MSAKSRYENVIGELRRGNTVPLYEVLQSDIGPWLWAKMKDIAVSAGIVAEGDEANGPQELTHWAFLTIVEDGNFIPHLLNSQSPPEGYLKLALQRRLWRLVQPFDRRKYYHAELEKVLKSASEIVMVQKNHFALKKYAEKQTFTGSWKELRASVDLRVGSPDRVQRKDWDAILYPVLGIAAAPVSFDVIWCIVRDVFALRPLAHFGIDDVLFIDSSGLEGAGVRKGISCSPEDKERLRVEFGDENRWEKLQSIALDHFEALSSVDRRVWECYVHEYLKREKDVLNLDPGRVTPRDWTINWKAVAGCSGMSANSGRNRVYDSENSILKTFAHSLGDHGFTIDDFKVAFRLLLDIGSGGEEGVHHE